MTETQYTERTQVRLSKQLKEKIDAKSRRTGISVAHVIRQALWAWVEQPDPPQITFETDQK